MVRVIELEPVEIDPGSGSKIGIYGHPGTCIVSNYVLVKAEP